MAWKRRGKTRRLWLIFGCFITITLIYYISKGSLQDVHITPFADDPMGGTNLAMAPAPITGLEMLRPADPLCTHYTCFDVYKCDSLSSSIPIKVYNFGEEDSSQWSQEFVSMMHHLSKRSTRSYSSPCILIPPLDTLAPNSHSKDPYYELTRRLQTLPQWDEGRNHLIFNFVPFTTKYDQILWTSKAIVASPFFTSFTYRPGFDVSIPYYVPLNLTTNQQKPASATQTPFLPSTSPLPSSTLMYSSNFLIYPTTSERSIFVSIPGMKFIPPILRLSIAQYIETHPGDMIPLYSCPGTDEEDVTCTKEGHKVPFPSFLFQSRFCLIGHRLELPASLAAGCVPVLLMDEVILPFPERVDWSWISVSFLSTTPVPFIMSFLKSIPDQKLVVMQHDGRLVYDRYFSSLEAIVDTTLSIIQDRIMPQYIAPPDDVSFACPIVTKSAPDKGPSVPQYKILQFSGFQSVVSPRMISYQNIGFTAVILSYERKHLLNQVIARLGRVPSCTQIIVVWNSQQSSPAPDRNQWPQTSVPLRVIQTARNSLNNRFYPFTSIRTDCVLAIDDDINMLTVDELEFGYTTWRQFPDRIVGFPSRVHRWDNTSHRWRYESEWTNDVSMVLTGAAFYHNQYNHEYSFRMMKEVREYVDLNMNCEDIAMNFLVANMTRKGPIKVTPRKKFKCPECSVRDSISSNVLKHLNRRSDCINAFVQMYGGHMPLQSVEFRADPVLFKDHLPEKLKLFNDIGTL